MAHNSQELAAQFLHLLQWSDVLDDRYGRGNLAVGGVNGSGVDQGGNGAPVGKLETYLFGAHAFALIEGTVKGKLLRGIYAAIGPLVYQGLLVPFQSVFWL